MKCQSYHVKKTTDLHKQQSGPYDHNIVLWYNHGVLGNLSIIIIIRGETKNLAQ